MPRFGPRPDYQRRRRATALRSRGLSLAKVGRRLGVSKQAAHYLLGAAERSRPARCRRCGAGLNSAAVLPRDGRKVPCPDCLAKRPRPGLAEQLRSYRLAAGLKVKALAKRAGTADGKISAFEPRRRSPTPRTLARLSRALGARLTPPPRGRVRG